MESKPVKADQAERPARVEAPSPPVRVEPLDAVSFAIMSALIPGLGQWGQGRRLVGALQFGTVAAYVISAIASGNQSAAWLGVAWNVWSSVDAFRHARREERWRDEVRSGSSEV